MISKTKTIIYLKRDSLNIANVKLGLGEKITMKASLPWNKKNILSILKDIPKTFKTDEVRLLIDPDICYSMIFEWKEEKLPTRKEIQKLAEERVPEHLESEWWDYKLLITDSEKKIFFFSPVKNIYQSFINGIKEIGLNHEGTYPLEFLPKTDNDFIAFAKVSLTGKDKDTLVVNPGTEKKESKKIEIKADDKKEKSKLPILLIALLLLSATLFFVLKNKSSSKENDLNSPAPTPVIESIISPVPTIEEISLEDYSLLILNSTKTAGLAGEAEEILLAEGFEIIETGNATDEISISTIATKKDTPTGVFDNIVRAINSEFELNEEMLELDEKSTYDVIITLGERKETAQ